MTFIKNLTVGLLSFLLFISLTVFGTAFMLRSTALNPDFVTGELNRIEVAPILDEFLSIESSPESPDLNELILDVTASIEPEVKERLNTAIYSTYDYLLGETEQPNTKLVLRNSFLNSDFLTSLIDDVDIASLAGFYLSQQLTESIPIEIENIDEHIATAISSAEPAIKRQIVNVSEPVIDYLLMDSQVLNTKMSLDEIKENLRVSLLEAFLDSPPPELASLPRSQLEYLFNQFYQGFSDSMPSEYPLDESIIGRDVPTEINSVITETEDVLQEVRRYVEYFQTGYTVSIILIALLVLGIVLVVRDVKKISRHLGIPLLIYGAIEYAGIIIGRYVAKAQLPSADLTPELEAWIYQFSVNIVKPLEIFSLGLLIVGAILLVVSFVYKRNDA